ncbi:hypothetical protein ACFQY7_28210 [Actinomadura luteofluorescens]|uniref:hypothetical protein n=1 Tax=Actinomadura luteofluorescens TaxID=46163 RepID=UPI00364057FB
MEIQALIDQLAGPDHKAAGDALVAVGEPAVRPVLAVLCDEDSPVDWATSATVLRRIGLPALGPLVEAMAAAPTGEVARRCGWAHCGLEIADLAAFVPGLSHPSPEVRANTAYVLQLKGEAALPHAPPCSPSWTIRTTTSGNASSGPSRGSGRASSRSCARSAVPAAPPAAGAWRPSPRSAARPRWTTVTWPCSGG